MEETAMIPGAVLQRCSGQGFGSERRCSATPLLAQGYGDSGKECDPLWDREKIRKKLIRKRIGNKKRLVAGTLSTVN
ncbi:MAG: hypothetical protein GY754_10090 [bacterium]|nr:hypothetical protein [bacterium]